MRFFSSTRRFIDWSSSSSSVIVVMNCLCLGCGFCSSSSRGYGFRIGLKWLEMIVHWNLCIVFQLNWLATNEPNSRINDCSSVIFAGKICDGSCCSDDAESELTLKATNNFDRLLRHHSRGLRGNLELTTKTFRSEYLSVFRCYRISRVDPYATIDWMTSQWVARIIYQNAWQQFAVTHLTLLDSIARTATTSISTLSSIFMNESSDAECILFDHPVGFILVWPIPAQHYDHVIAELMTGL